MKYAIRAIIYALGAGDIGSAWRLLLDIQKNADISNAYWGGRVI